MIQLILLLYQSPLRIPLENIFEDVKVQEN